jgi:hypothetical protein
LRAVIARAPIVVSVVTVAGLVLVGPGQSAASAQTGPSITSVSAITAQNDSDLPDSEQSGPGLIITGSGFGATPPTVCQADNDTTPGESAIGLDVLTNNLQIVDTSHFSDQDMGNCSNEPHDDCDVSIGSWTDTQITVLLDDTGGIDCDDIDNGDNLTVQVFTTDTGNAASNVVSTTAVPLGAVAQISGLSPASGPVAGGTFNTDGSANANGTITITGSNVAGTTIVWFGNGGDDGAIATTNFTFGTDGSGNPDIIVTPPPAPAGYDEGTDVVLTGSGGTSVVACTAIDEGCEGTYYWQSPSSVLPTISGSTGTLNINGSLSVSLAIPQAGGACPGSSPAGGTGVSFSASASITGGPISFSGQFQTSENDDLLSSVQAPITVTVASAVSFAITLGGSVSGCYAVPIPDLNIPGLGGLYVLIGGDLAAGYTFTATINQGTFIVDAGYVANQVDGAAIVSQNCTDGMGNAVPCVQTSSAGEVSGTLDFSPLWLGVDITDIPGLTFSAGAGLTLAAFVTDSTGGGFDYDVCFGATYAVVGSVGSVSLSTQGVIFGPFNIFGDGTQCPLGAIGAGLPSTAVSVTSSDNPVPVGQQVTYTATVSPTDGGGTVSFADSGAPIAACEDQPVNASGQATCDQTYPGTGSHSIVATYSGDTGFAGSVSAALAETVSGSVTATATTLASSANPATVGQQVTYTATVSPTDGGGTVSFSDGGTAISACQSLALSGGQAGCAQTYTTPGTHPIVATYSGDATFGGSASATVNQVVSSSVTATTTVLTSSANPSAVSQQVTYMATVSPTDNGGTVSFTAAGKAISGCQSVAVSNGSAACPQTYTAAGSHSIVAAYSGDTSYGASKSAALNQVVGSYTATTTKLVTSANPATVGKDVTYTATVSPTDDSGTVTFTYGGTDLPGCKAVALNSSGKATCPIEWVSGGTTSIEATYSGDTKYAASTSNIIIQVVGTGKTPTTTKLVTSANPATVGKIVIYTATVTPTTVYGGTVTFTYGGTDLPGCKAVALNSSWQATCAIIWISGGTTSIVAKYSGDTRFAASTSNSITQVVTTAFTATASAASITYGHAETLTGSGLPSAATGTVTFISKQGLLCSAKVAKGKASCATATTRAPGVYNLTARYSGNEANASATTSFVITQATTKMTAKATPASTPTGHAVTLSVSGLPTGATGNVTFTDSAGTLCKAKAAKGIASCQTPKDLAVGKYAVTVTYAGNTDYYGTTAQTTFTITKS